MSSSEMGPTGEWVESDGERSETVVVGRKCGADSDRSVAGDDGFVVGAGADLLLDASIVDLCENEAILVLGEEVSAESDATSFASEDQRKRKRISVCLIDERFVCPFRVEFIRL